MKISWSFGPWALLTAVGVVEAIGQDSCVTFESSPSAFLVTQGGQTAPILVSDADSPSVIRAVGDFQTDIYSVSGSKPKVYNVTGSSIPKISSNPIIVGTLASPLIQQVVNSSGLDVTSLTGKWETFIAQEVTKPLPGISKAYVIIGSDRRGAIYAMYELSEQIGVSPWYWWADVPVKKHNNIYVSACRHGPPTVKYRGIFINDEQPALQSWAQEKFTNGTGQPFNHFFYGKVFELILRLRGNYLWPAMWGAMFNVDDPLNQPLAHHFGVVMGTSHQEPMMRSSPNEFNKFYGQKWNWTTNEVNITQYMREGAQRAAPYESLFTMGMRGDGDLPLEESTNIALLEDIITTQRGILTDVFNGTDIKTIPQVWTLYKEVQAYYEHGLQVPDDVTLLWADDNWGNIRRFPLESERNRTGGAGVYYHFDYVGSPRDYKWIISTQLEKVHEQMSLAHERGADRIWIVNVGDLKPYELATEFFLSYGYNTTRINQNTISKYVTQWATREFALPSRSADIAAVIANVTRFNARRKPELWNTTMYSLTDYREADNSLDAWKATFDVSKSIYDSLQSSYKASFFELVHHPVSASYTLARLLITAGKNNLYATQARISTNDLADQAEDLFEADYDLENQYHTMLSGKWNHMMDQTHVGYAYWQQPQTNTMPAVNRVHSRKQALAGPMRIAIEGNRGAWPGDNPNQCAQGYNCPPPTLRTIDNYTPFASRYIDISSGGPNSFTFSITPSNPWIKLSTSKGSVTRTKPEVRVEVSVDFSQVSGASTSGSVVITSTSSGQASQSVTVYVNAAKNSVSTGFKGFVEGDGAVVIEAAHSTSNTSVAGIAWTELPGYGKTVSAVTPRPATANGGASFTAGSGPSLSYSFYTFNAATTLTSYISPSLNAYGTDRPLGFAVQIDQESPQSIYFMPAAASGQLPKAWDGENGFVANAIVTYTTKHTVSPGAHTLKVWMVEPAVVLQKFVLDTGGVRASYLGPPESVILK